MFYHQVHATALPVSTKNMYNQVGVLGNGNSSNNLR